MQTSRRYEFILIALILFMWMDLSIAKARYEGQLLHYNPVNGDFQTYNPLRRIAEGQAPGRDFQPYMGLGVTYATYLPFALLGKDFAASKASAQITHSALFTLGTFILFLILGCRATLSIALTFLVYLYAYVASDFLYAFTNSSSAGFSETALPLGQTLIALSRPENSCLGIRTALPFLSAGALLFLYREPRTPKGEALFWGALAGIQVPWSNDYGFVSMAMLLATYQLFIIQKDRLKLTALNLAAASIGFIAILTLATHGYPLRWASYNFSGVAKDQFWYFMLDETDKVFSLTAFLRAKRVMVMIGVFCLFGGGLLIAALRENKPKLRDILLLYLIGCALAASLISAIGGGIMERYFAAALRLMPFVIAYCLYRVIPAKAAIQSRRWIPAFAGMAVTVGGIFYLYFHPVSLFNVNEKLAEKTGANYFYATQTGGYLQNSQKKEIAIADYLREYYANVPPEKRMFSTYSSLMDAVSHSRQASGIDYIIHALGKENRARYLQSFLDTKPYLVTTPDETHNQWEVWSRRVNWWFYREMLKTYRPTISTYYHTIWTQRSTPLNPDALAPAFTCTAEQKSPTETHLHIRNTGILSGNYYVELNIPQQTDLKPSGVPVIGSRAILVVEEHQSALDTIFGKGISGEYNRSYNADYTQNPQMLMVEHRAGNESLLILHVAPPERATLSVSGCEVTGAYAVPAPPSPESAFRPDLIPSPR